MKFKYAYIYKITNLINNKIYIGQHSTNNLDDGYFGSGKILNRSINKNGKNNFKKEIIEFCDSFEALQEREIYWIDQSNCLHPIGYNLSKGGQQGVSFIKNKPSWNKGLPKEQQPNYGKKFTEESKQKIRNSKAKNPYKHSIERRQLISEKRKGIKLNLSEEQLQKKRKDCSFIPNETTRKLMSINNGRYWKNKPAVGRKPIYQVDKNTGEIIKKWDCIQHATKQYTKNITHCIIKLKGTASGFIWVYEKDLDQIANIIEYNKKNIRHGPIKILINGVSYNNIKEASSLLNLSIFLIKKELRNNNPNFKI